LVIFTAYMSQKRQSPVHIEWSFLLHKCNKNVSHLLTLLLHLFSLWNKKDQLNINRWLMFWLHFYSIKDQFNINRWLTFLLHWCSLCSKKNKIVIHLLILNWSFLLHICHKNVSHLLILNGHFYCINVTKTSVTC
jgi:hypothetical protein